MAVDTVEVSSTVDAYGNSYTSAVSNDKLTNEDFMLLLIEQIKNQDPTNPMDTAEMMDSQLKMSTIQSNMEMAEAMTALQSSYANSALSTAANLIGHIVEDGSTDSDGLGQSFKVETIENQDGELYANVRQMVGYDDILTQTYTDEDGEEVTELALYDGNGFIYDGDEKTVYRIDLDEDGNFVLDDDGGITIYDENGDVVTDEEILARYSYGGSQVAYAEDLTTLPLSSIIKVR
jgi:flagellar basal-body rod modification protein FlgD